MPTPRFPGFPKELHTFFRGLEKNNGKEWFEPRKEIYLEKAKAPMEALVDVLNAELAEAGAPEFVTEPKKAIYRIYRDTRFSKDKTPYKTHVGALWTHRGLEKHSSAGFYVGVSHKTVEVAGGVYMPQPEQIQVLRNLLAERYEEFRKLTASKPFVKLNGELRGDQLARIPKGFAADHPAEDLLRRKQWYWYVELEPELALSPKIAGEIKKRFVSMLPVIRIFNAALAERKKKDPARLLLEF